jgi:PIN domain nuclease of toxin-antitoxin system
VGRGESRKVGQNLLLDTHALIWWAFDRAKVPVATLDLIENSDNNVYVSAVSAMEIATKVRLGKLDEARPLSLNFAEQIVERGCSPLALTLAHGQRGGNLAIPHNDPFDRLLIAQAQIEQMTLVSNEKRFDAFGVVRLW